MSFTSTRGIVAEYQAAILLSSAGYVINWPMDPTSPYDLLVEKDGQFLKVQVKVARWERKTPTTSALRVSTTAGNGVRRRTYAVGDFDLLCAIDDSRMWLIPFVDCLNTSSLSLDWRGAKLRKTRKTYDPRKWLVIP